MIVLQVIEARGYHSYLTPQFCGEMVGESDYTGGKLMLKRKSWRRWYLPFRNKFPPTVSARPLGHAG